MKWPRTVAFLRTAAFAALAVVLTLCACEAALRLSSVLRGYYAGDRARLNWETRLWNLWLADAPEQKFFPPFPLFANRDADDPARISRALEHARLPPSGRWNPVDFLQDPESAQASRFAVSSNSLGFRGPERRAVKPSGVFRVIALGAYMTFGQGVDDGATYPAQLEALLNKRSHPGDPRYEVWNGGIQGSTAFIGLSRLRREIFQYRPDLIVLEYGFVDCAIMDDDLMPLDLRFPARFLSGRARSWSRRASGVLGKLFLTHWLTGWYWSDYRERSVQRWMQTMELALDECRRRGVPVVLLGHPLVAEMLTPRYRQLERPGRGVAFVSAYDAFTASAPSDEALRAFDRQPNWLDRSRPFQGYLPRARPFFVDMYHPSPEGHRVIAEALTSVVENFARDRRP